MKTLAYTCAVAACLAVATMAQAHDYRVGDLKITQPWAKASLRGVPNSAAYMTITNTGAENDALVAAAADVSEAVELHTMTMKDGVMRMRRLDGGVPLPADETIALKPGGKHIMLIGLRNGLEAGSTFEMTLSFQKAGKQTVDVTVVRPYSGETGDAS